MPGGPNPSAAEVSDEDVHAQSAAGRLFDLRWLIAAMSGVYGVVLIITGLFDNQVEIKEAAGVRINSGPASACW